MRQPENSLGRNYHCFLEEDFNLIAERTVNKMRGSSASSKFTMVSPDGHVMCLIGIIDTTPIRRKEYMT
jgi:hypothetical protein